MIAHERVGNRMAGPAIRCWELARVLSRQFSVTLATPGASAIQGESFALLFYVFDDPDSLAMLERVAREQADVVISNGHLVMELPFLQDLSVPWVADVYIPTPVESLAWHALSDPVQRTKGYEHAWCGTRAVARYADFFLCASERQRDFWLGVLAAYGRLRPELYTGDSDLRNLIDVVPFGCPKEPPQPSSVLKGVWPGIGPRDRVILWGGGVWNWFDPLTLLRAMPQVLARHPEARLVFLGANHPDSARVPEMQRAREARALSHSLGLEEQFIFWGDWVPYAERGAYLLEADVGVSLHRTGIEARLAFRTRLLDSIWAGLPMVLSRGDVLTEEFERLGLGYVVNCGAVDEVARAINALLDEPDARSTRRAAFDALRQRFSWDRVAEPLVRFCQSPCKGLGKQDAAVLLDSVAEREKAASRAEIARLREIVHGYESGRLMRILAALHRLHGRLQRM